jgi:hypothetical protein
MGNSACCEGINNCYLQDESKTWEDDAVDKGSLEEVLSIVCHRYIVLLFLFHYSGETSFHG